MLMYSTFFGYVSCVDIHRPEADLLPSVNSVGGSVKSYLLAVATTNFRRIWGLLATSGWSAKLRAKSVYYTGFV